MTMDERFEAWFNENVGRGADAVDREQAFHAGGRANQQLVIEAITGLMRTDEQLALSPDGYNESLTELKKQIEGQSS